MRTTRMSLRRKWKNCRGPPFFCMASPGCSQGRTSKRISSRKLSINTLTINNAEVSAVLQDASRYFFPPTPLLLQISLPFLSIPPPSYLLHLLSRRLGLSWTSSNQYTKLLLQHHRPALPARSSAHSSTRDAPTRQPGTQPLAPNSANDAHASK